MQQNGLNYIQMKTNSKNGTQAQRNASLEAQNVKAPVNKAAAEALAAFGEGEVESLTRRSIQGYPIQEHEPLQNYNQRLDLFARLLAGKLKVEHTS